MSWRPWGETMQSFMQTPWTGEPGMLDQVLVNKNMLAENKPVRALRESVEIFRVPGMVSGGRYPAPIRFSRPNKSSYNPDGYSDHYPVVMKIETNA